jgi:ubiquinone/menaquinone biosynthesis C-methylase UbiE
MDGSTELAKRHWNRTPLFISEEQRYSIYPWLYDAAEFRNHGGERVLEIGCGTGCDLLQFAKHGAHAYGIDITERHITLAKQRCGTMVSVCYGDARFIPFRPATFDYVYSHGVVHHSDQPEAIVAEIFRVLKPGGRYNVQVYSLVSYHSLYLFLKFGKDWKLHIENSTDPVHIDLYTIGGIKQLFRGCSVKKFYFPRIPVLAPYLGWYLVVTGAKPKNAQ